MFVEATADLGELTLSGGARLDRWGISDGKLLERVIATGASLRDDRFGDRSGWLPTARTELVREASPATDARPNRCRWGAPPSRGFSFGPLAWPVHKAAA